MRKAKTYGDSQATISSVRRGPLWRLSALFLTAAVLAACTFVDEDIWPQITGDLPFVTIDESALPPARPKAPADAKPSLPQAERGAALVGKLTPYIVVRFDEQPGDYRTQLSRAVKTALDRKANAIFDIVALAPAKGGPEAMIAARAAASEMLRELVRIGVSPDRIAMATSSNTAVPSRELRLYVQ